MFTTWILLVLGIAEVRSHGESKIIDLTHVLDSDSVYWPGNPTFDFNILIRKQVNTYWYESNNFSTAEHGGTHLDAPAHFYKNGWRVDDIPLTHLIGPGVVIDISARAKESPDAQVEIDDLLKWEEDHGEIPARAMVLMNSGWSSHWPNKTLVFGTDTPDDPSTFHYPGFSPSATQWLVDNRNYINAIGVDTPSLDHGLTRDFLSHVTAFSANIVGLENIARLNKVPASGSTIFAIPINIKDGSGAPMRIFAMLSDDKSAGKSLPVTIFSTLTKLLSRFMV